MGPSILYKYFGLHRAKVLAAREIRFTPPELLDDPFESLPLITGPNRDSVRRRLGSSENLDAVMASFGPYVQAEGPAAALRLVSQTYGFLCLSSAPDSTMLWSHYGANQRGYVMGFDFQHPWFHTQVPADPLLDEVRPVVYQAGRPAAAIGYTADMEAAERTALACSLFFTKADSWSFQQEWRLVRPLARADHVERPEGQPSVHLFAYPPDAVVEIVLGARIDAVYSEEIHQARLDGGLTHSRMRRARLSSSTYSLHLDDEAT